MTGLYDARDVLVDLISRLFHAAVLITEQAERIEGSKPRSAGCGRRWPRQPRRREPPPGCREPAASWSEPR